MAWDRQSQGNVWVPGECFLMLLCGFLDSRLFSGIKWDTEFTFHWLTEKNPLTNVWAFGVLYLNFERVLGIAIVGFASPPPPSVSLVLALLPAPILPCLPLLCWGAINTFLSLPPAEPCCSCQGPRRPPFISQVLARGVFLNKCLALHERKHWWIHFFFM